MNIAVTWDRNDVSVRACCDCKYEVSYSAKRVTRVLISRIQTCALKEWKGGDIIVKYFHHGGKFISIFPTS